MDYIVAILILLLVLKIIELQRRVSHLEDHDPARPRKSVRVERRNTADSDSPHVYVIPEMSRSHASG